MHDKYKIPVAAKIKLGDLNTRDSQLYFEEEKAAKKVISADIGKMAKLQQKLYAGGNKSLLVIFQGMDTAGKDSCIRHLFSGVNPQGCSVTSFKAPTPEELAHDFMWRHYPALPAKGHISIYNRSYYEEVLITRVHPELLLRENIPSIGKPADAKGKFWKTRFDTINAFERGLAASGTTILKIFLHISKKEQKSRLLDRIAKKDKHWKFDPGDLTERESWAKYTRAYEDMLSHTSTAAGHWYVVPADEKWYSRVIVGRIVFQALEEMDLHFPGVTKEQKTAMVNAKKELVKE